MWLIDMESTSSSAEVDRKDIYTGKSPPGASLEKRGASSQVNKYRPKDSIAVMESKYLNNGDALVGYRVGKINKEIPQPNLNYLLKYIEHMRIEGKNPRTIARHLREMRFVLSILKIDAIQATKEDIEKVVLNVNTSKKAPISRRKILLTIRVFWKWLLKADEYPPVVKFIKPKAAANSASIVTDRAMEGE